MVRDALRRYSRRYGIRVYEFANAGNHLHLLVRAKCRLALQNFLRVFAGIVARRVTGARRGLRVGPFWDMLAYSRVMSWGRDFFGVRAYVVQNELEALRLVPYRARNHTKRGSAEFRRFLE
jgi:REP element-mobilizing transposase RayT